jgi:hypothetical protein
MGLFRRARLAADFFFGRPPSLPHARSWRLLYFLARARPPIRAISETVNTFGIGGILEPAGNYCKHFALVRSDRWDPWSPQPVAQGS